MFEVRELTPEKWVLLARGKSMQNGAVTAVSLSYFDACDKDDAMRQLGPLISGQERVARPLPSQAQQDNAPKEVGNEKG